MREFGHFYLDIEKDMIVDLYMEEDRLFYVLRTPNHHSGNLITNFAKLCELPITFDEKGLKIIEGEIPCYVDANNRRMYIFRLANTKVANIYPDGSVEMKASIPSISKTLMSQTKDYKLDANRTIIKTYILEDCKFRTDLHTHMNANLHPDVLIALGIFHQIRYPLYYVKKLGLCLTESQWKSLESERQMAKEQYDDSSLTGKYRDRRIDDHTYINFADLILGNLSDAADNIARIRASLTIMKDGQAVFTNLEKVYVYRYVFTKGISSDQLKELKGIEGIPDQDIVRYLNQMIRDKKSEAYRNNTLFQNKLLWIARTYASQGIQYVEISDTTLVKKSAAIEELLQIHEVMPRITAETGVMLRFLAAMRRIPLTLIRGEEEKRNYLEENLETLRVVAADPYVAGCDFVGEEINSILELKQVIKEVVRIANENDGFVIRIHAGENDSLKDNVLNSIRLVRSSLLPGQKMPRMRIGHGLYTASLKSKKGRELLHLLQENPIVLEFQISSNVRLNNLNSLDRHPLKQYLSNGVSCVEGTDGAAIYGTNSIDEQLSLERLLGLSNAEQKKMKEIESIIISDSRETFARKMEEISKENLREFYQKREREAERKKIRIRSSLQYDAERELKNQIREYPWDKVPVVVAGGSFNTERRSTRIHEDSRRIIERLMQELDPEEVFFVIGHRMEGYEKYLVENNVKGFDIYSVVPSVIDKKEREVLTSADVHVRISPEIKGMAIYKSINYEIFEQRGSVVIAFDGNSAGANLIQEAKNGKGKVRIFVNRNDQHLKRKAESLKGYVTLFDHESVADEVLKAVNDMKDQQVKR